MADDVGSLLLNAGMVTPHSLEVAREVVAKIGGTLSEQLVRQGDLDDDELTQFYCNKLLVPRINPSQLAKISAQVLEKLPADMATEFRAVPVSIDREGSLTLIMSDPSDAKAADEIGFFTGCFIVRATTTQALIAWCLSHYYDQVTPLHNDLVEKGDWPKTRGNNADKADKTEAPTAPLQITIHAEEPSVVVAVPKKIQRPANQQPSPPELSARAGEITSQKKTRHRPHSIQPAVVVAPLEPTSIVVSLEEDAVPDMEQRGTDTSPFLLSSIKPDQDGSGPILLSAKGKTIRRPARNTFVGIGSLGRDADNPWEKALAKHTSSRGGFRDTVQMRPIFLDDESIPNAIDDENTEPSVDEFSEVPLEVPPGAPVTEVTPEGEEEQTEVSPVTDEEQTDPGVPPESTSDSDENLDLAADELRDVARIVDKDVARIVDMVGDDWGPPGSTIPPAYIGAAPEAYDKFSDSIPILIQDDVTMEMPAIKLERNVFEEHSSPIPSKTGSEDEVIQLSNKAGSDDGVVQLSDKAGSDDGVVQLSDKAGSDDGVVQSAPIALVSGKIASNVVSALRSIDNAEDKSDVVEVLLSFLDLGFERNGFLALRNNTLVPWRLHGGPDDASPTVDIKESSVFGALVDEQTPYSGPVSDGEKQLARDLDFAEANILLALPMTIKGRTFGVLFGLSSQMSHLDEHVVVLAEAACEAFERLIMSNRT